MRKLIANRDILFDGKQYRPGEELPTYDTRMVELWKRGGSAEFVGENGESSEAEDVEKPEPKARAKHKA